MDFVSSLAETFKDWFRHVSDLQGFGHARIMACKMHAGPLRDMHATESLERRRAETRERPGIGLGSLLAVQRPQLVLRGLQPLAS